MLPLEDILVVSIEQAVAAPVCTARLSEAGARVIKIERETGDFARGYDNVAGGDCSYFFWTNLGKESLTLDFKNREDQKLLHKIIARADVFVQNLAPGALQRAGFGSDALRDRYPHLITCDITGYGSNQAVQNMKAYDFLVQAESGLVSISGGKNEFGRVGVSICDINAGMNAHAGILEALIRKMKTGKGSGIEVSLFGTAADWMTVPLLHYDYGGKAPARAGLNHPSIAPYGGYRTADGQMVIVAVQNQREWARFCDQVLDQAELADDPRFMDNNHRVDNRNEMDKILLSITETLTRNEFIEKLVSADIAYGAVNDIAGLSSHPALTRRSGISSQGEVIHFPTRPIHQKNNMSNQQDTDQPQAPRIGQHSQAIRREFA